MTTRSQIVRGRMPFKYAIRTLSSEDLALSTTTASSDSKGEPAEVAEVSESKVADVVNEIIPTDDIVETAIAEEPAVEDTTTEPTVEETPVVAVAVETLLADCEEFSANSVKYLAANDITTVEQLLEYIDAGIALEDLKKIGVKSAKVILEEVSLWRQGKKQN